MHAHLEIIFLYFNNSWTNHLYLLIIIQLNKVFFSLFCCNKYKFFKEYIIDHQEYIKLKIMWTNFRRINQNAFYKISSSLEHKKVVFYKARLVLQLERIQINLPGIMYKNKWIIAWFSAEQTMLPIFQNKYRHLCKITRLWTNLKQFKKLTNHKPHSNLCPYHMLLCVKLYSFLNKINLKPTKRQLSGRLKYLHVSSLAIFQRQ